MKSNLATNTSGWPARDCGSKECNPDGFRFALAGMQKLALVLAMTFLFLAPNATTHAQDIRGQIQGKIVDSSGAFVEGARITAVELATSVGKTGVSNSKGDFVMPFLPAGHYRVTVEKEGFKRRAERYSASGLGQYLIEHLLADRRCRDWCYGQFDRSGDPNCRCRSRLRH